MKKAFTLLELLFVFAVIAIIAGFAISEFSAASKRAIMQSMLNDARNTVYTQQVFFSEYGAYDRAKGTGYSSKDTITGENGAVFTVSKGNTLETYPIDCDDGSQGYYVRVYNWDITPREIRNPLVVSDDWLEENLGDECLEIIDPYIINYNSCKGGYIK